MERRINERIVKLEAKNAALRERIDALSKKVVA